MKQKIFLITSLIVFTIILVMGISYAKDTENIVINNFKVKEKTDTTTVSDVKFDEDSLNANVTFNKVGDYVTYEVVLNNNDSKDYWLKTISDDNTNQYIVYEYSNFNNEKIKAKSKKSFDITAKYSKEVKDVELRNQKTALTIQLTFSDEEGNIKTETINVNTKNQEQSKGTIVKENIVQKIAVATGDNIILFFAMLIGALIVIFLVLTNKKTRKHGKKFFIILAFMLVVCPNIAKATSNNSNIKFESNYSLKDKLVISYKNDDKQYTIIVKYGEKAQLPNDLSKNGYEFKGWYKDSEGKEKFDLDQPITEDYEIYPIFELEEYTITYVLDGGTATNPTKYTSNDSFTLNNPTKEGYTFSGWTGSNGNVLQTKVTIEKNSTGNKKYVANYSANQDTKYVVIHKTMDVDGISYSVKETEELFGASGSTVKPQTKKYEGFEKPEEQEIVIKGDGSTVLEYKYPRKKFTIDYSKLDPNIDQTKSSPAGEYYYGSEFKLVAKELEDKNFIKWSTDEEETEINVIVKSDLTEISLIYETKTYAVIFDANDGTGSIPNEIFEYNEEKELTENSFTRVGFRFVGWNTKADGTGDTYEDKEVVKNLAESGTIKLYAQWESVVTEFLSGKIVNVKLKNLAGTNTDESGYETNDDAIKKIKKASSLPSNLELSDDNIISVENSAKPIYAWFDNGIIYYYSEAENLQFGADCSNMFDGILHVKEIEINSIDTSNVTNMEKMFCGCGSEKDFADEDKLATPLVLDVSNFNTSNVTNMSGLFKDCYFLLNVDVSNFNTDNVIDMSYMFASCHSLSSLDISNFNTENVTNMSNMFNNLNEITTLDVSGFDTEKVTDMNCMFANVKKVEILNLSNFDTSLVTNMSQMFYKCEKLANLSLDSTKFNTNNVTNMVRMFENCRELTELDLSDFNTNNVTNMNRMFLDCVKLQSLNLGENFVTGKVTDMGLMFNNCLKLTSLNLSSFDTSKVTDMSLMFCNCSELESITISDLFDTGEVINMNKMFEKCHSLKNIDVSSFDTSKVTNMSQMFLDCYSLEQIVGLNGFETSEVTTMKEMFANCNTLTELDVSSFNTGKVTDMNSMFVNLKKVTELDVSGFNTAKVTDMSKMFANLNKVNELNVSSFETGLVTNMSQMFYQCNDMTSLNLNSTKFITSGVTDMSRMFEGCKKIESLDVSGFNTSEVITMEKMFANCDLLESLDFTNWDTSKVTNMNSFVYNDTKLSAEITIKGNVADYGSIFVGTSSVSGNVVVNYTSDTESIVDGMIATANGNVEKGTLK